MASNENEIYYNAKKRQIINDLKERRYAMFREINQKPDIHFWLQTRINYLSECHKLLQELKLVD